MRVYLTVAMMLLTLLMASALSAQSIFQEQAFADGRAVTDWREGFIEASAVATADPDGNRVLMRLRAIEAARLLARRRLLGQLNGIQITSTSTVEDYRSAGILAADRIRGTLRNSVTTDETVRWVNIGDGVEVPEAVVTVRACLFDDAPACAPYGGSGKGVMRTMGMPEVIRVSADPIAAPQPAVFQEVITPAAAPVAPAPASVPSAPDPVTQAAPEPAPAITVHGLVVDASATSMIPLTQPEILAENGEAVYTAGMVASDAFTRHGLAQFATSVDEARTIDYIGDSVLVVEAIGLDEQDRLLISNRDAARVAAANLNNGNFLRQAKVAVILP